jgi:hypothetical protein
MAAAICHTQQIHINFIGYGRNIAVRASFISRGFNDWRPNLSGSAWTRALTLLAAGFAISYALLSKQAIEASPGDVESDGDKSGSVVQIETQ